MPALSAVGLQAIVMLHEEGRPGGQEWLAPQRIEAAALQASPVHITALGCRDLLLRPTSCHGVFADTACTCLPGC